MTSTLRLAELRAAARRREIAIALACAAPPAIAAIAGALRIGGVVAASIAALFAGVLVAWLSQRAARRVDDVWLARRIDTALPGMDDSTALLLGDPAALGSLQRLQRARIADRLAGAHVDLRAPWPARELALAAGAAGLVLLAVALWRPFNRLDERKIGADPASAPSATATQLTRAEMAIESPAYTGLPPRTETVLDAKAVTGAVLRWRLRFDTAPTAVSLQFHDGSTLAFDREGDAWTGTRVLAASILYRVVFEGAPPLREDRLFRLDAMADQPPEIHVLAPDRTLTVLEPEQKTWRLAFDASDDYGIAAARINLTLAQGTGENITFKEQTITLDGTPLGAGGAHRLHYERTLELATLGIAAGDDVIVKLAVDDNRAPTPNTTRSASFILRWPVAPSRETAGMEGIVQKTMPAYFRSQRQIIIDSEALIATRATLDDAAFLARSDTIGVDQKILRLRYGQFLGEESETHDAHAEAEGADAGSAAAAPSADQADALDKARQAHEKAQPAVPSKFGSEGNVLADYGHVHDEAEAATLLDPETKATLKSALSEMWQAELHLRMGKPDEALPYEHRALEFIKRVQQSTRIYLARVGLELPAPDEARRLSGDRTSLRDVGGSLAAAEASAAGILPLWKALAEGTTPPWGAAQAWLRAREASAPDALGVLAALDAARRDPECAACRQRLHDALWPLLPTPAAATTSRADPDAAGRAYLDALAAPAVQP